MRGNDRLDVLGPERLDVGLVEFQCSEALDRHRALVRGHSTFRPVAHNSDLDLTEDPVVAYRKEGDGLALPHPTGAGAARSADTLGHRIPPLADFEEGLPTADLD